MTERKETGLLLPPKKKPGKASVVDQINEERKRAIRRIVHSYFQRNELPILNKFVVTIQADAN